MAAVASGDGLELVAGLSGFRAQVPPKIRHVEELLHAKSVMANVLPLAWCGLWRGRITTRIASSECLVTSHYKVTPALLVMDLEILYHGQVTRTTPELDPLSKLLYHANWRALSHGRFNVYLLLCSGTRA
ncbi:hypothetical protein TNCV_5034091 [Trichonephila clavipes]|nr:hypothetical protein TNCV_5034091 [Trichonephila clavipes]